VAGGTAPGTTNGPTRDAGGAHQHLGAQRTAKTGPNGILNLCALLPPIRPDRDPQLGAAIVKIDGITGGAGTTTRHRIR